MGFPDVELFKPQQVNSGLKILDRMSNSKRYATKCCKNVCRFPPNFMPLIIFAAKKKDERNQKEP